MMDRTGGDTDSFSAALERNSDLIAVALFVGLCNVVFFAPATRGTHLRLLFALGFVLFAPGYAIVSALFPRSNERKTTPVDDDQLDWLERVTFSVSVSIAMVVLIGFTLALTSFELSATSMVIALDGVTVLSALVATYRRSNVLDPLQPGDDAKAAMAALRQWMIGQGRPLDAILTIAVVLSIVIVVGSVISSTGAEPTGFTEFYLSTPNDSGTFRVGSPPTEITSGETVPVQIGIGNHEGKRVDYWVVIKLQRVDSTANGSTVIESRRLSQFEVSVADGETRTVVEEVSSPLVGDRLQYLFLLYKSQPPANPDIDTAYREVHIWVNVSQSSQTT